MKDRFAGLVHRFDCFLKPCRRSNRAEVTGGINFHSGSVGNGHPKHTGDKRPCLRSLDANANLTGLARFPAVADIDVVVADSEA